MAKFMVQFSYTKDGLEGLSKEGGTGRRTAIGQLVTSLGGKLEAVYWSMGEWDGFVIAEFPDNLAVAATAIIVGRAGTARTMTTLLLTPEDMDEVVKRHGLYRPPGQ